MMGSADNASGRTPTEWDRARINAFIKARLDDIDHMHEPYGTLKLEIVYVKGKVTQVVDERRMTHK
jgi:hypothetical protein